MSATPNNAMWNAPPVPGTANAAQSEPEGRDALQALLAFASLHQQADRKKQANYQSREDDLRLDDVLRLVAVRALSLTGADGVAIALAEEDAIVCRASAGSIAPGAGVRLDPYSGFSGACLREGKTVRCDDSDSDSRVNAEACRALGTRSMIAVPLMAIRRVAGLLEAFSSEPFGFNDADVRSLELLGELVLAAVRPEEEEHLAELAENVIPLAKTAKAQPSAESKSAGSAKILVDEKFTPAAPALTTAAVTPAAPATEGDSVMTGALAMPIAPALPEPPADPITNSSQPSTEERHTVLPLVNVKIQPKSVPMEAPGSLPIVEHPLRNILVTAALVLVAIALGWIWMWKYRHVEQAISASASTRPIQTTKPMEEAPVETSPPPDLKPGASPQVTGIRHWSSADASTVVVDLEDQVQYEAHSIENPARVYFDLHDTKLASGLLNQSITVDDSFIKRVRMAQPVEGITRVVLETKGQPQFSVKLDPGPYRLTIEVHNPGHASVQPPSPFLSKPSPSVSAGPKRKTGGSADLAPSDFRIVLDAGHGGWDLGTVGRKGLLEKDLVLDIVQRLGKLIADKMGSEVIYTRQDDSYLPLEKRAEVANVARADLFLSVHANYSDLATARGVETYYTNTYSSVKARSGEDGATLKDVNWTGVDIREKVTGSHRFASDVQQALYGALAANNPDVRNRGVKEAQYVVLTGTQMPAVLAEVSFVSSPADESKLQSSEYRQQIAEALYRGVAKFRDERKGTKLAKN